MPRPVRFLLSACVVALLPLSAHADDVTLAWDPPAGTHPAGYRVRYRPIASSAIAERDAGRATSLRITALAQETTYEFHVVAYDAAGLTSAPSNYLRVTIGPSAPPPAEPVPQPPSPAPASTVQTPYFPGLAGGEPSRLEPYQAFLAVGTHDLTFKTRLSLANPTSSPARAMVYLRRDGDELSHVTPVVLPAFSHVEVDAETILGPRMGTFGIGITANVPIGVRRTMTWNAGGGGHSELATPTPSARWYFADGATHGRFALFYHLLNPGPALAMVSTTYLLPSGASLVRYHDLPPGTRKTVFVNHEDPDLASTAVAAVVESLTGQPIVAERALYLNGPNGYVDGHVMLGATELLSHRLPGEGATGWRHGTNRPEGHAAMPAPGTAGRWLIVGGPQQGAHRPANHVVVANPSDTWQSVRLTVLGPTGALASTLAEIAPQRRHDVDMTATFPDISGTYSVLLEAVGGAGRIAVEQSIYWGAGREVWGAGIARPAHPLHD